MSDIIKDVYYTYLGGWKITDVGWVKYVNNQPVTPALIFGNYLSDQFLKPYIIHLEET